jgi:aspartate racemase
MKTIGIIGGLGPPSTVKYYEWLTEGVQQALGGQNSARIILTSLNGEDVKNFRVSGDKEGESAFYAREAKRLEQAGADFILIASNTSHKNAPAIEKAISIPLLHLADATAAYVRSKGVKKVGLLGTAPTMEEEFYKSRLAAQGLEVLIPEADDRAFISSSIYNEMVKNIVRPEVNAAFIDIIGKLEAVGAEGVILGCTELTLLDLSSVRLPLFDTVKIHVEAALKEALS